MFDGPYTFLLGDYRIAEAAPGRSKHAHTFGGPPDRRGTDRAQCNGLHLHLLHRLDLTDPAVPVTLPGLRWLPLYYCFDPFSANAIGYRLISDEEMVAFIPKVSPNVTSEESWPGD